jgi:hypothetical protein
MNFDFFGGIVISQGVQQQCHTESEKKMDFYIVPPEYKP